MARPKRQFGAIRKLPSGRWQARYWGEDGKRRSAPTTFAAKADANAWLSKQQTELVEGTWRPPEPSRETFGAYGKRWLASRPDLRPRTRELYDALWRRWLEPTWADVPLAKMTPEGWRTWWAKTTTAHPGSTQPGKAYRLARAILNTAVNDELILRNPCRVEGAGKDTAGERPVVTPDQVDAIAQAIDAPYKAMVLLAAHCALRFGELAGLTRDRIDLLHRTVTIDRQAVELGNGTVTFGPPKSEAGRRRLGIPPDVVPVIEDHLRDHVGADPGSLVFASPGGHSLRRSKFRHKWTSARDAAGIAGLHFHDLRHSGLTWAGQAGATARELMYRAGHSSVASSMRYQHATAERDQELATRMAARRSDSAGVLKLVEGRHT